MLLVLAGCNSPVRPSAPARPALASTAPSSLDTSADAVSTAALEVLRVSLYHGSVPFLEGQWGGCADETVEWLQYDVVSKVVGRDKAAGTTRLSVLLYDNLTALRWNLDYRRGSQDRAVLGFSRDGIRVEVDQTYGLPALLSVSGPCLHTDPARAERLLRQPARSLLPGGRR